MLDPHGDAEHQGEELAALRRRVVELEARVAEGQQTTAALRQCEERLERLHCRQEALNRLRDRILALEQLDDLPRALDELWVDELRALGIPVYNVSLQLPLPAPGAFASHVSPLGLHSLARETTTGAYPWIAEVWESGEPVIVGRERLACADMPPQIASLVEVPLHGLGSLGVNSIVEHAFDAEAVAIIQAFAGLIAEGLQRLRDLETLGRERDLNAHLMEVSPVGLVVMDRQGVAVFANARAEQVMGLSRTQFLDLPHDAVPWRITSLDGGPYPVEEHPFVRVLTTGAPVWDIRYAVHRVDGRQIFLSVNAVPLFSEHGQVERVVLSLADITAETTAHQALQGSERRFRELAELIPGAIYEMDASGRITYASRQAYALFGYTPEDVARGVYAPDLVAPQDRERAAADLSRGLRGEPLGLVEYLALRRDGAVFPALSSSSLIDESGHPAGMRGFILDISERKQMERQLAEQRVRALEADRLQVLGEMAAGVAHELNQPLMALSTTAEDLLLRLADGLEVGRETLREMMGDQLGMVERMVTIIEQLRVFSQDTSTEPGAPFSPNEAVQGSLRMIGRQLANHGIQVIQELTPALPSVLGHVHQIEQVLLNLLGNARDALDERRARTPSLASWRPVLGIRTGVVDGGAEAWIAVWDTGGGIAPELIDRVYEPFFTTKTAGRGTGLGLAIARNIVDRHTGRLELANRPGEGVTFTVVLPAFAG